MEKARSSAALTAVSLAFVCLLSSFGCATRRNSGVVDPIDLDGAVNTSPALTEAEAAAFCDAENGRSATCDHFFDEGEGGLGACPATINCRLTGIHETLRDEFIACMGARACSETRYACLGMLRSQDPAGVRAQCALYANQCDDDEFDLLKGDTGCDSILTIGSATTQAAILDCFKLSTPCGTAQACLDAAVGANEGKICP